MGSNVNGWIIDSDVFREGKSYFVYAYCPCCKNRRRVRIGDIQSGKSSRCKLCSDSYRKYKNEYIIINEYEFILSLTHIKTKDNYEFIIDLKYMNEIKKYYWGVIRSNTNIYARSTGEIESLCRLHRFICYLEYGEEFIHGKVIDHKNRNTLDNRLVNLNIVTPLENAQNANVRKDNVSGVKGVNFSNRYNKWVARIQFNNKRIQLGVFDTIEDAKCARLKAEEKYHRYNQSIKEEVNEV